MAENEKTEKVVPTNEFDVQIAQVRADIEKHEFQFTSELMKIKIAQADKTKRTEKIVSSLERVLLGGMVLTGVIYVTDKRYGIVESVALGNE